MTLLTLVTLLISVSQEYVFSIHLAVLRWINGENLKFYSHKNHI